MNPLLLVVNAGSSSLKFGVYESDGDKVLDLTYSGRVTGIGSTSPRFRVGSSDRPGLVDRELAAHEVSSLDQAQALVSDWLAQNLKRDPDAVGHRIVHGGPNYHDSVLVTPAVLQELEGLASLAPLHQRNNLHPVHVIGQRHPLLPQVACFDTAFHRGHRDVVERFAIPERFFQQGVRRYGFHGLSYEYIAGHLKRHYQQKADGRVIVAHLGSGASACAMKAGLSVETTMGFTALDGLPMCTRPGRLDAGVVLWMMEQGMSHEDIQHVLYYESGLKGLSGLTDMRELLASDQPQAELALAYFAYRTAESIAGLCVALGGLDMLVFTAGIGENCPEVRARVCRHLEWLGLKLDRQANQRNASSIAAGGSAVSVLVVPTNEEWVIANKTLRVLTGRKS
ncbi:acetate/propionate family kinase [Neopusillimonas maritima]|uniref:Acetate kinase n=1 Tax=Neopusillimonas maritima TaxID=2026239 RepID=A0A3A1YTW8_9BURK|nr:acetate/propionate family kinase [Neopusillimonas maritima]RIY40946.1 acetate kinase [Neopusillimonas maritima]